MSLYLGKYRIEPARLRDWDYRARGWYFVTVCAHNRACIFGEIVHAEVRLSSVGRIAESELRNLPGHYENVQVDSFIVMPNHVHAIFAIDGHHSFSPNPTKLPSTNPISGLSPPQARSLSAIVRAYKAGVTRQCHRTGLKQFIWQARFHDHLLRGDAVIGAVREYIRNNPANWPHDKGHP